MTPAEALVNTIESVGGVLTLVGDRIRYQLPEDQAPSLVNLLGQLKPAVIRVLQQREQQPYPELTPVEIKELNDSYRTRYDGFTPPSYPCQRCGSREYWRRCENGHLIGTYHCTGCYPPPHDVATIPALPPGVKLISWNPKPGPVALNYCAVVTNVPQFIDYTLEQLAAALDSQSRSWHARAWSLRDLVERLEQVGVVVQLESNKEA